MTLDELNLIKARCQYRQEGKHTVFRGPSEAELLEIFRLSERQLIREEIQNRERKLIAESPSK